MSELCNALTGGFSLMGFGSFCAAANDEPSGLFPEVRPAYLDLMPECVETRDTAPQLRSGKPVPDPQVPSGQARGSGGPTLRFLVACNEFAARPY